MLLMSGRGTFQTKVRARGFRLSRKNPVVSRETNTLWYCPSCSYVHLDPGESHEGMRADGSFGVVFGGVTTHCSSTDSLME